MEGRKQRYERDKGKEKETIRNEDTKETVPC
jgi:hypothetical protein